MKNINLLENEKNIYFRNVQQNLQQNLSPNQQQNLLPNQQQNLLPNQQQNLLQNQFITRKVYNDPSKGNYIVYIIVSLSIVIVSFIMINFTMNFIFY